MTRATDLRYGRRGGGWVPAGPVKEHRMPHTYTELPCPDRSCAGVVRRPTVRGDQWVERCDGEFTHEFTVHRADALIATHRPRPTAEPVPAPVPVTPPWEVTTVVGPTDASQQWIDALPGFSDPIGGA